ncbi:hypothetical protein E2C01_072131 [Portunus trituberculatus]|uniref:Uncharacterized protein n=1 Tax=Portunus trituberculatus TaxID=210409 RepID=A0A5B7I1U3_PORTR|nr:hypothetical protein [Portunus trituberculatus]
MTDTFTSKWVALWSRGDTLDQRYFGGGHPTLTQSHVNSGRGVYIFRSMQKALVDQLQDSGVALYLPSSFTFSTKMDLRKSSLDSGFLIDQDWVTATLDMAEKIASLTF